jgi:hypothetical protein
MNSDLLKQFGFFTTPKGLNLSYNSFSMVIDSLHYVALKTDAVPYSRLRIRITLMRIRI